MQPVATGLIVGFYYFSVLLSSLSPCFTELLIPPLSRSNRMTHHSKNFFTIPENSFSIFVGTRLFLTETISDILKKCNYRKILYVCSSADRSNLPHINEEQNWIELRELNNPVDILVVVENDPVRFMIIEYNPQWFDENPEYILPFGHLCRERSKRRQEVLLISPIWDKTIIELESIADKLVFIQDSLTSPNKNTCNISQVTLFDTSQVREICKIPSRKYGQQVLGT